MSDMEAAAREWIANNEKAMALMQRYAEQVLASGRECGIALIIQRLRWDWKIAIERGDESFRINNSHQTVIVRELIKRNPQLAKVFKLRTAEMDLVTV